MTAGYTTKELSKRTWPDFERLFSQGNGWDFCWCTAYQRGASGGRKASGLKLEKVPRNRAEWNEVNHRVKRDLVEDGRAHGILVYEGEEPVGWCQFGPAAELPIADEPQDDGSGKPFWKVTCFVTLKDHRSSGVAGAGLRAAVEAIRESGGGRIEGYPYVHLTDDPKPDPRWRELREIVRRDGPVTYYSGKAFLRHDVQVDGIDHPVNGVYWRGTGMFHAGTMAMFEREGFKAIGVVPPSVRKKSPWLQASRVVMQKTVLARRGKR